MGNKIMIAETERLILRRYTENDLQDLYEYLSNPRVVSYEPYKPMTMEEVKENLQWRISSDADRNLIKVLKSGNEKREKGKDNCKMMK